MNRTAALALLAAGCSVLPAPVPPAPVASTTVVRPPPMNHDTPIPVVDTVAQIEAVVASLHALTPEQRQEAGRALDALVVACPWTRAAHQLVLALHQEASEVHSCLETEGTGDWALLKRGLAAHVAALDLLEVDLPQPAMGDPLFGLPFGVIVDRAELAAVDDPMAQSRLLVDAIPGLVDRFDDATHATLDERRWRAESAMGHRPALDQELRGWTSALAQLEASLEDPHGRARIRTMLEVLEAYDRTGC